MDASRIIQLLEDQQSHCRRLLRLCEIQHTLVVQDRHDELLKVLSMRQTEVDAVLEIENQLRPLKQDWSTAMAGLHEESRSRVEALVARNRELLAGIAQADESDALVMQQRKLTVAQQIQHTRVGGVAQRRYAADAYTNTKVDVSR